MPARSSAGRGHLAGRGPRGQARPAGRHRLPDDLDRHLRRRCAAGGHLVREARPVLDRHAPLRALASTRPSRRPWEARVGLRPLRRPGRRVLPPGRGPPRRSAATSWPCRCSTTAPDECAQPGGRALDWAAGECDPVPGRTMPRLVVVERDYPHLVERCRALGPLVDELGATTKGVRLPVGDEVGYLRSRNGTIRGGVADGRPRIDRDDLFCEAILALSGTTNGRLAVAGFEELETPHRRGAGRPGPRAGRGPHHLRRHRDPAPVGDLLAGVVGVRVRTAALRAVHHQRGAPEAVAHPHRPPALPRSTTTGWPSSARCCPPTGRRSTSLATFGDQRRAELGRATSWWPATSRRTRSGRSTPSTRTTSTCSTCSAAGRSSG